MQLRRKRKTPPPEAVFGADGFLFVKHTHDLDVARELMANALREQYSWPADSITRQLTRYKVCWVRQTPALASSYAASAGWPYAFHEQDHPARGAYPSIIFLDYHP